MAMLYFTCNIEGLINSILHKAFLLPPPGDNQVHYLKEIRSIILPGSFLLWGAVILWVPTLAMCLGIKLPGCCRNRALAKEMRTAIYSLYDSSIAFLLFILFFIIIRRNEEILPLVAILMPALLILTFFRINALPLITGAKQLNCTISGSMMFYGYLWCWLAGLLLTLGWISINKVAIHGDIYIDNRLFFHTFMYTVLGVLSSFFITKEPSSFYDKAVILIFGILTALVEFKLSLVFLGYAILHTALLFFSWSLIDYKLSSFHTNTSTTVSQKL